MENSPAQNAKSWNEEDEIFSSSVVALVLIPVATSLVAPLVLLVTRFLIWEQTRKRNYWYESSFFSLFCVFSNPNPC